MSRDLPHPEIAGQKSLLEANERNGLHGPARGVSLPSRRLALREAIRIFIGHHAVMTSGLGSANEEQARKSSSRGLRDGFGAYATVRFDDFKRIFRFGTIILDANALLNLYRYTPSVCADFLNAMGSISARIWIPHQVVVEFWRNRESALSDFNKASDQAVSALRKGLEVQQQALRVWAKRVSLAVEERDALLERLHAVTESTAAELSSHRGAWLKEAEDTSKDRVLAQLEQVLDGRIGLPFTAEERQQAITEANRRIELEIPPGYEDKKKPPEKRVGDYLLWLQIIRECKDKGWSDVLFVTGDTKPDWWRHDDRGEPLGPRTELHDELLKAADARLYMLRPDQFLQHIAAVMGVPIANSSVVEVERVDLESHALRNLKDYVRKFDALRALTQYSLYLSNVKGFDFEVMPMDGDVPFDLMVQNGDNMYYVCYFSSPLNVRSAIGEMRRKHSDWLSQFDSSGGMQTKYVALLPSAPAIGFGTWGDTADVYIIWPWSSMYIGTAGASAEGLADDEM